ncbi:MAG: hypothetical protein KBS70_08315 [Bacteroidales bacterium]|nr:hypothetical protein [Candidatus Colicola equi]
MKKAITIICAVLLAVAAHAQESPVLVCKINEDAKVEKWHDKFILGMYDSNDEFDSLFLGGTPGAAVELLQSIVTLIEQKGDYIAMKNSGRDCMIINMEDGTAMVTFSKSKANPIISATAIKKAIKGIQEYGRK